MFCQTEAVPLNRSLSLLSAVPEKLMETVLHCLVIHFGNIVMKSSKFLDKKMHFRVNLVQLM